ncbi:MAG: nucleotidyltransferase domain-containing protein [Deltaproteobacteria bacterium]
MARSIPPPLVPLLGEYHRRLEILLGDRLVGLRLYGSWARGEQGPESDVDLAVLVNDRLPFADERAAAMLGYEIAGRFDLPLSPKILAIADYRRLVAREHPFYEAIEQEGIPA